MLLQPKKGEVGDLLGDGGRVVLIGCGRADDISYIPRGRVPSFCEVSSVINYHLYTPTCCRGDRTSDWLTG